MAQIQLQYTQTVWVTVDTETRQVINVQTDDGPSFDPKGEVWLFAGEGRRYNEHEVLAEDDPIIPQAIDITETADWPTW